jgi:hypothetical protein
VQASASGFANAGTADGTGSAYDATCSNTPRTNAQAGVASAIGIAHPIVVNDPPKRLIEAVLSGQFIEATITNTFMAADITATFHAATITIPTVEVTMTQPGIEADLQL